MKAILPVCALSLLASFTAFAASPSPAPKGGQDVPQACDNTGDHSKYCKWKGGNFGTPGRECDIDVETIDQDPCDFQSNTAHEMADHTPICISSKLGEHIVFNSTKGRTYRIRRLVPLDTNAASCPAQPFAQVFDEKDFDKVGTTFDTKAANQSAVGCFYKLEVQFRTIDPNGPHDPHDPQSGRKLECRDPHLGVK